MKEYSAKLDIDASKFGLAERDGFLDDGSKCNEFACSLFPDIELSGDFVKKNKQQFTRIMENELLRAASEGVVGVVWRMRPEMAIRSLECATIHTDWKKQTRYTPKMYARFYYEYKTAEAE